MLPRPGLLWGAGLAALAGTARRREGRRGGTVAPDWELAALFHAQILQRELDGSRAGLSGQLSAALSPKARDVRQSYSRLLAAARPVFGHVQLKVIGGCRAAQSGGVAGLRAGFAGDERAAGGLGAQNRRNQSRDLSVVHFMQGKPMKTSGCRVCCKAYLAVTAGDPVSASSGALCQVARKNRAGWIKRFAHLEAARRFTTEQQAGFECSCRRRRFTRCQALSAGL